MTQKKQEHCKVLILEDDIFTAAALSDALRAAGHEVCGTAATEDDALRLGAEHQPDIAVVDLRLKAGSGLNAAHILRRSFATRVIFATGHAEALHPRVPHDSLLVLKPYDPGLLLEAIDALCNHLNILDAPLPAGVYRADAFRTERQRTGS